MWTVAQLLEVSLNEHRRIFGHDKLGSITPCLIWQAIGTLSVLVTDRFGERTLTPTPVVDASKQNTSLQALRRDKAIV